MGEVGGTSDGKQLAITRRTWQGYVEVGELEGGGHNLKNARRLTLEESMDTPCEWTPDSKSVTFLSKRNGTWGIYRERLDQSTAQPVAIGGPDFKGCSVVSPDGSWIVYLSTTIGAASTAPGRIMRVPISGGPPQLVLEGPGIVDDFCARPPATLCSFMEETSDHKQTVFVGFDPIRARGKELTRVRLLRPREPIGADLSPAASLPRRVPLATGGADA